MKLMYCWTRIKSIKTNIFNQHNQESNVGNLKANLKELCALIGGIYNNLLFERFLKFQQKKQILFKLEDYKKSQECVATHWLLNYSEVVSVLDNEIIHNIFQKNMVFVFLNSSQQMMLVVIISMMILAIINFLMIYQLQYIFYVLFFLFCHHKNIIFCIVFIFIFNQYEEKNINFFFYDSAAHAFLNTVYYYFKAIVSLN
ncbi:hypothetical protein RFI_29510 [Reticulomyxa filosa]|uniref:Transmembrane protein n=1 Tax=Reticulomyxa filosa TaxID=46433 RepID=X6M1Z7_RETFI|nr:hypothetical protein RFI_29510 [Reticulomyxa filosa]|eukprot:ETO07879.1 hypothetical protein RFI_29510 [Reticulomyxa filosa]